MGFIVPAVDSWVICSEIQSRPVSSIFEPESLDFWIERLHRGVA
jgi:hypothetical protein